MVFFIAHVSDLRDAFEAHAEKVVEGGGRGGKGRGKGKGRARGRGRGRGKKEQADEPEGEPPSPADVDEPEEDLQASPPKMLVSPPPQQPEKRQRVPKGKPKAQVKEPSVPSTPVNRDLALVLASVSDEPKKSEVSQAKKTDLQDARKEKAKQALIKLQDTPELIPGEGFDKVNPVLQLASMSRSFCAQRFNTVPSQRSFTMKPPDGADSTAKPINVVLYSSSFYVQKMIKGCAIESFEFKARFNPPSCSPGSLPGRQEGGRHRTLAQVRLCQGRVRASARTCEIL